MAHLVLVCVVGILAFFVGGNASDHCIMRGTCSEDEITGLKKPCVYNGTAVPLKNETYINVLNNICPFLKTGPDFSVCCDVDQVETFRTSLDALGALFKRCPSCYHNLANVFCQLVCSPEQSSFMEVVSSEKNSVEEINYYITEHYATGLFDSCKDVRLEFTSSTAMSMFCGASDEPCSPHRWLDFMGGHDPSPYQINFKYHTVDTVAVNGASFHPMNETVVPCSQAVGPGTAPCSCEDCPCNTEPQ